MIFEKKHFDKYCNGASYNETKDVHLVNHDRFCIIYAYALHITKKQAKNFLSDKNILDAGCAFGDVVKDLIDNEINAIGYDASKYAIKNKVTKKVFLNDNDSYFEKAEDSSFDIIFTNSFQYAKSVAQAQRWIDQSFRICRHSVLFVSLVQEHMDRSINNFGQILEHKSWWNKMFLKAGFKKAIWVSGSMCIYLKEK